jgi:hypothetical protein
MMNTLASDSRPMDTCVPYIHKALVTTERLEAVSTAWLKRDTRPGHGDHPVTRNAVRYGEQCVLVSGAPALPYAARPMMEAVPIHGPGSHPSSGYPPSANATIVQFTARTRTPANRRTAPAWRA